MSHSKERKEKICLNCNASLYGRYCHVCGQENIEPKQSAWHLVTHFFYDITHFDGKFFTTLKDLVVKPGFLSREFITGRRFSYLNPVRMYVFTSAFFFIIFFSIYNPTKSFRFTEKEKGTRDSVINLESAMQKALKQADNQQDSAAIREAFSRLKNIPLKPKTDSAGKKDTSGLSMAFNPQKGYDYESIGEYDSAQKKLSPDKRDGWMKTMVVHKVIYLSHKYKEDKAGFFREWMTALVHSFPKLLFISLPIFALLLKLLYIRRRNFYYADHGVFSIHLYIYTFIALLVIFAVNGIRDAGGWGWLNFVNAAIYIFSLYYFYKAMRNFYLQGRGKTILKYMLLGLFSFIMIMGLFSFFVLFSALEI